MEKELENVHPQLLKFFDRYFSNTETKYNTKQGGADITYFPDGKTAFWTVEIMPEIYSVIVEPKFFNYLSSLGGFTENEIKQSFLYWMNQNDDRKFDFVLTKNF